MRIFFTILTILTANINLFSQNNYSVSIDPSPCAPFDVTFTPNIGANVGIIQYDLGLGGPPETDFSLAPVTYSYPSDGTYWTSATFYDFNGDFINSSSQQVVIAGFNYFITTNAAFQNPTNTTISFDINTMDNINSVSWDFDDGNTSSAISASHAYTSPGNYTVTATVDSESCGVLTLTTTIQVIDLAVTETGAPCTPAEITLTASSNDPNVALYQFLTPEGNSPISASNEFQVTFTTPGIKNYSVLSFDNAQNQIGQLESQIEVFGNDYTISTNLPANETLIDYEVAFTLNAGAGTTAVPTNLTWEFGDGTTSSDQNPMHGYTALGSYAVYAIYENSCGVIDSVEFELEVQPINVLFTNEICINNTIQFLYDGPELAYAYEWNFTNISTGLGYGTTTFFPQLNYGFTESGLFLGELELWDNTYTVSYGIYEFYVTVNDPNELNTIATSCGSYFWNGTDYSTSGIYTANVCSATFTLDLTITPSYNYTIDIEECGDYTDPNFGYFDQSGIYTFDYTTVDGCDSNYVLNITINPFPSEPTLTLGANNELIASGGDSYNWYSCDGDTYTLVPGINGATLLGQTGQFAATAVSAEGCESWYSPCMFTDNDDEPLSVDENQLQNISLYPNPSSNIVTIEGIENFSSVAIYDALGKLIRTYNLDAANTLSVSVNEFEGGMYFVKINNDQTTVTKRLMVK